MRSLRAPGVHPLILLLVAFGLGACPDLPRSEGESFDATFFPEPDVLLDGEGLDVLIPLAITRVRASLGEPEGGERVTILGAGMNPGARVFFGDVPASGILVLDEVSLNCDVPAHDPGLVDVRIELLDGQAATLEKGYLYRGPLRYGGISPELGPLSGGVQVTITGEGFDEETRALIGGRLLEGLERVSDTTLTGDLPGQMYGHSGLADVIVTNGFEQRTGERVFRYVTPLSVARLDPPGGARAGGTTLTIQGEGLEAGTQVRLDGVLTETIEEGDGTQIVVRTPPLPHGAATLSLVNAIDVLEIERAWMSVDPEQVPAGVYVAHAGPAVASVVGGEVLDLIVSGLAAAATPLNITVRVDGSEATVLSVDAESDWVRVILPPGASGLADVMVQTPTESAARIGLFQRAPLLAIASVEPGDGLASGGEELIVLGVGFEQGVQVFFGAIEASEVVVESDQMLRITTPEAQPGRVDLSVALEGQTARAASGFSYYADGPPRLLAISPEYGSRAGSRVVRLHGTGLRGGTGEESVLFGIQSVPNLGPLDDTTIVVRTRSDDDGRVNVDAGELGLLAMPYEAYDPTQRYGGVQGGPSREAVNVTVLELVTREPVDGAMVIWWDDLGTPHQGLTDLRGQITLSDVGLEGPHMITAGKNMYTTSSVVDFGSRDVTLLLLSLSPPAEGDGGDGEIPEPIPQSPLSGEVTGYDKYVLPPPGDCDSKIAAGVIDPESTLCAPCTGDEECGDGAVCTALGDQGSRCTVACEGTDDCPEGFSCVGTGFGAIQCIPSPGQRTAWCGTTQSDVFSYGGSDPFLTGFTNGVDSFAVEASPGEHAIVCIGGYRDPDTDEFIPMMMGVRRHVFALPGESLVGQDVELDIPLERTMRIRLDGAPIGVGTARNHAVDVFIDLGADGVFRMPSRGVSVDENNFELEGFPTVFEDSLTGASYSFLAAAVPDATLAGESNDAALTFLEDVVSLDEDSIVHVTEIGVLTDSTGMVEDVADLQGPGDGTLWAASVDGRVLRYDGTWWGLHQTPSHADLKAVFESPLGEVYTVGDDGAFFRFTGLIWEPIAMPDSLLGADWWALTGTLSTVFLAGSRGVYAYDGGAWTPINPGPDAPQGTMRDVWSDGFDTLWMVGDGGRIRRWEGGQTTVFDQPGSDLLAVHGSHGADVWAVGRQGRVAHFDGELFFDFLPRVRHDLHGVHGADPANAWAVGDAGAALSWDGERWQVLGEGVNVDLRAVRSTGSGPVIAGGLHTVILGPFLDIPRSVNPTALGDVLGLDLRWSADDPELADLTYLQLLEMSGFPFWTLFLRGERMDVPLPDYMALAGIFTIWPGSGWIRAWRIHAPGLSIDDHTGRDMSQTVWRSWSVSDFPALWP